MVKPTVEQFRKVAIASGGIKSQMAKKFRVTRQTIHVWVTTMPEYAEVYDEAKQSTIDFAESKLMGAVSEGNMTAIIFYLKTQAKERGYVERIETVDKSATFSEEDIEDTKKRMFGSHAGDIEEKLLERL